MEKIDRIKARDTDPKNLKDTIKTTNPIKTPNTVKFIMTSPFPNFRLSPDFNTYFILKRSIFKLSTVLLHIKITIYLKY